MSNVVRAVVVLMLVFAGCANSDTGDVDLAVAVSALSANDVAAVQVTVNGPGMTQMQVQLVHVGTAWKGTLGGIPAGSDRVFTAVATDASGAPIYQGQSAPVTIAPHSTATVIIELTQVNPPMTFGNHAPHLDALFVSSNAVAPGETVNLSAAATDGDGDALTFSWTGGGAFASGAAASTQWTAPATEGTYPLTVTVADPHGAFDAVSVTIDVHASNGRGAATFDLSFNSYPEVQNLTLSSGHLEPGVTAVAAATALDADGDALSYSWSDDCGGSWVSFGSSAQITIPATTTATQCTLHVDVSDGRGAANQGNLVVQVGDASVDVAPVVDSTFQSTNTADNGGTVELRVTAHDAQDAAAPLTFAWTSTVGTVTQTTTGGESDATWTAPSCFTGSAQVTVTISDQHGGSTVQTYDISAIGSACVVSCTRQFTLPQIGTSFDATAGALFYTAGPTGFYRYAGGASSQFNFVDTWGYNTGAAWANHGSRVYYSVSFEPGVGSIYAVNNDGTGNQLISNAEAYQAGVVTDNTYVYWARSYPGYYAIRRAPLAGGTVETIADSGSEPRGLVLINGVLYWTAHNDNALYSLRTDLSQPRQFITGISGPEGMTTDGSTVILTDDAGDVLRYDPAATTLTTLAQGQTGISYLRATATDVFVSRNTGDLVQIPLTPGTPTTVVNIPGLSPLSLDGSTLYAGSTTTGDVWTCAL